jgi:hypothetical protein
MSPKRVKSFDANEKGEVSGKPELVATKEEPKTLTEAEVERLEKHRLLCEFRDKELELIDSKVEAIGLQTTIHKLSLRNLELTKNELLSKKRETSEKSQADKISRVKTLDKIKSRLGIEGNFGYNPDTLEVIQ